MKFLKYILFLLLILAIGFAIYIAVQPNEFSVTRTRNIQAPPAVIYNNVSDFKNWEAWSSWVEEKPDTKITLSDKTVGVGGSYTWEDDDGVGTMKTIAVDPNKSINQEMQFGEFPSSDVSWDFKPDSKGGTDVTWNISGKDLPFVFKFFSTIMGGMEKQIGSHFERGLEKLDDIVVKSMEAYSISESVITEYGGGFYMYKTTAVTSENISQVMGKQYGEIIGYMYKNNIKQTGMPFTIYDEPDANGNVIMSQAIPIQNRVMASPGSEVLCGYIPKTKALKTTLKGNYTYLHNAWETTMKYVSENDLQQSNLKPFEIYQTDPDNYPNPADWITEIYIPLKD